MKGLAAAGYGAFFLFFCAGCAGLPVLAGLFGGVAFGVRFGVVAGVLSAILISGAVLRARRRKACQVPRRVSV